MNQGKQFPVVGIGASAGGLESLEKFFDHMPENSGMGFVIVQHVSPDFKSLMDELLGRRTKIPIHRVQDAMPLQPDAIYLIPPRKNMIVSSGKLMLTEQDPSGGLNLPIDFFFRSLALDIGKQSIAVVLSGSGSDGSRGICDVHNVGGLVIAEDPNTSAFDGMPRSAIGTGIVDIVASPEKKPEAILSRMAGHPDVKPASEGDEVLLPGDEMPAIYRLFRSRYGVDFTLYRPNTVNRRLDRRMRLSGYRDLSDYVELLEADSGELDELFRDLLVEVTHFFRDREMFQNLRREVIPEIVRDAGPRGEVRVWVPGCATGEEAYSLAMLVHDATQEMKLYPAIKIFATDIHRNSLETASSGVFSEEDVRQIPRDLLERYFSRHGDWYHISRELRQSVIFAPHDITKDPPFTKIDLLSCRNVLIYLDTLVQRRVLAMFHFGMKVNGTLVLGPSESLGDHSREFECLDQRWRVFRKLRDVRLAEAKVAPMSPALTTVIRTEPPHGLTTQLQRSNIESDVLEDLLDRYVPPSMLVNEHFELMYSFGDARKFLVQPKGRPTTEIIKLVRGDLRMALSAAMHRASRENQRIVFQAVRTETDAGSWHVQVAVEPYINQKQKMFLVCLEPVETRRQEVGTTEEEFDADDHTAQRIVDLERELDYTKETLQATVEELETSNEEMQATNEELVAANEELQSTNEELHSVNEELYTVNAEHQRKIVELTQLTSDMDNLLRSTEIGTIFLDKQLRIRRFTPGIAETFNLISQDVGRWIDSFTYSILDSDLVLEIKQVLEIGAPFEREVRDRDDRWYLMRILPYLYDGKVDGVVLTLIEITTLKAAERKLAEVSEIVEHAYDAIMRLSPDGTVTTWNVGAEKLFGFSRDEVIGKNVSLLVPLNMPPNGKPSSRTPSRVRRSTASKHSLLARMATSSMFP